MSEKNQAHDPDLDETRDWLAALDGVLQHGGEERAVYLLKQLLYQLRKKGAVMPFTAETDYINTIAPAEEPVFPGNLQIERQLKSINRWNAMAMVVNANKNTPGIGGHISTFASAATLYEVGFNHFFRPRKKGHPGDLVYYQGHASPGIYARAYLEGRLSEDDLKKFRRELSPDKGRGLPSYPHPRLMPDFWQFPTVSMGLGPIGAIYQARFMRYMQHRGLLEPKDAKVWAFLGDGECDEPETLGGIRLAAREKLDNLIFVVNCNLQRLDGPVRGNGKIIQELEGIFRGAGWNVLKVIWGSNWDPLFDEDKDQVLREIMMETVDGEYQKLSSNVDGEYIREHFFNKKPGGKKLVEHMSDEEILQLRRGGHDPKKVFSAYRRAVDSEGRPTVILAKTVKGYGLGYAGQGKNVAHNTKKLDEKAVLEFRTRFGVPLSDDDAKALKFFRPAEDSPEMKYLKKRREILGDSVPVRHEDADALPQPDEKHFDKLYAGSNDREVSTTMGLVTLLSSLMNDKDIGKNVVPIVPDEARTFGMEGLFKKFGIYSDKGQLYEPVDQDSLTPYREAKDGQIIEEGLSESGAIASFIAAGTSWSTFGQNMLPFYIYYSMFGFQRVGDQIWAAMDMKTKGFLVGAVAGRTTLNGEGLQHEDGHSHLLMSMVPDCLSYDPAFAYELAVIVRDGIQRMVVNNEPIFYHLTVYNEAYEQPAKPKGDEVDEGILRGLYRLQKSRKRGKTQVHLLGSGSILRESVRAAEILEKSFGINTDVWSATSYNRLRTEALEIENWNRLNPTKKTKKSYLESTLESQNGVFVAASDYVKALPHGISPWVPGGLVSLGTDGWGM